ncbi:MAG: hypothetical protein GSR77_06880 [Desulfurococcales archaeon]|nr:hypothetical protein [Desulfurococcales archaeon]
MTECNQVKIETGSRLHGGFYTLPTTNKVAWASIGIYTSYPKNEITIQKCDKTTIHPRDPYIEKILHKIQTTLNIQDNYCITINEKIPRHHGLGSTTQTIMALTTGIYALENNKLPSRNKSYQLARQLNRGYPSSAGIQTFLYGGILATHNAPSHIPIWHTALPSNWRVILVIPKLPRGFSEEEEQTISYENPWRAPERIQRMAYQGLIDLMKGVANEDVDQAVSGLKQIQSATGSYFSRVQGGSYRADLAIIVDEAWRDGIFLAQSSWGPTLYTLTTRDREASDIKTLKLISKLVGLDTYVLSVTPRNMPASIECLEKP